MHVDASPALRRTVHLTPRLAPRPTRWPTSHQHYYPLPITLTSSLHINVRKLLCFLRSHLLNCICDTQLMLSFIAANGCDEEPISVIAIHCPTFQHKLTSQQRPVSSS